MITKQILPLLIVLALALVLIAALPAAAEGTYTITCVASGADGLLNDARFTISGNPLGSSWHLWRDGIIGPGGNTSNNTQTWQSTDTNTHTYTITRYISGAFVPVATQSCPPPPPPDPDPEPEPEPEPDPVLPPAPAADAAPPAPPAPVDSDGDGVPDGADNCPGAQSLGYGVNQYGCPAFPTNSLLNWNGDPNSPTFDGRMNHADPAAEYVVFCTGGTVQVWHGTGYLADVISQAAVSALSSAGENTNMTLGNFAIGRSGSRLTVEKLGGGFAYDFAYADCIR